MIRQARATDDRTLALIDRDTWSLEMTPALEPTTNKRFFGPEDRLRDVLVAELDGGVVGYLKLGAPLAGPANRHVLQIQGLAVARGHQRRGIARRLLDAAIDEARKRRVRRLTLRVLAGNDAARKLYDSFGFEVEGILREEFLIDGRYVDDVLMARSVGLD